jgi:hypothetical protein
MVSLYLLPVKFQQLIALSKANLTTNPTYINGVVSANIFELGAKWMFDHLNKGEINKEKHFNSSTNYFTYGLLKYGSCIFAFLLSVFLFAKLNYYLLPLSIIVFYLVEIHFLFLFPLLIDNAEKPIWTSIKLTYKMCILKSLVTIIPIGFYMVFGLFNLKAPFYNWYVGCLAIIIWYQNEVRNRI